MMVEQTAGRSKERAICDGSLVVRMAVLFKLMTTMRMNLQRAVLRHRAGNSLLAAIAIETQTEQSHATQTVKHKDAIRSHLQSDSYFVANSNRNLRVTIALCFKTHTGIAIVTLGFQGYDVFCFKIATGIKIVTL